jgi:peroxiredoxin/imidazolonepropionase-like amidohydrolase
MVAKHILSSLIICALIWLTAIVYAAGDTPAVGTTAPDFQLITNEGNQASLKDYRGKWVVLYFYPKDFTSGCTLEAHNFQRDLAKYAQANSVILGISIDTAESHKSFCAKEGLNFKLLSDPDAKTSAAYGSVLESNGAALSARNTFIIDSEGKIAKIFVDVKPGGHSEEVLSALTDLQATTKLSASAPPGPEVRKYLRVSTPKAILEHVQIIDDTGAAPITDQNISIVGGKISAISPGADSTESDGTTILNLRGYSVMPGIVGMHDHLFYFARPNLAADNSFNGPALFVQMSYSAPRLYLANGVTTARTTGSVTPDTDLRIKQAIEAGVVPGPHLDVTGPYLEGAGNNPNLQIRQLTGPEDAQQTVAYWADRGVTSFKAYTHITRAELSAAVKEAHKRGLKVTGHLCSVTYAEAVEVGIDNLEHGFFVNTADDPDKKPDNCSASGGDYTLEHMIPGSPEADRLIATLVRHHVAITSTLPGLAATVAREASADGGPPLRPAVLEAMSPSLRDAYLSWRNRPRPPSKAALLLRREMELERAFVAAGGLLLAGPDPVGIGGNVPGFGDQREIELLVEAGFTPVQGIRIATLNGAIYLARQDQIGSIAIGKNADLVVMKGDPAARIADIEKVEIVFKDGLGYDTKKLLDSVKGHYGEY